MSDAPERLRRFYKTVTTGTPDHAGNATILLDARPIKTPRKRALLVPERVAEAIAREWATQETFIEPTTMPLTRLANTAIDGVAEAADAVKAEIVKIAGSDLVAYRADAPAGLVARERAAWDPLVAFVKERFGLTLAVTDGLMPVAQPSALNDAIGGVLPDTPLALAGVHSVASLSGSAIIAVALHTGAIDAQTAWHAAHVEEDWNIEEWGEDALAAERRAARKRDFDAAVFLQGR
ncbi:MAG: ATP12 family protein [Pseudomonadota bacterium]